MPRATQIIEPSLDELKKQSRFAPSFQAWIEDNGIMKYIYVSGLDYEFNEKLRFIRTWYKARIEQKDTSLDFQGKLF